MVIFWWGNALHIYFIIMLPLIIAGHACGWWRQRVEYQGRVYWRRQDGTFADNWGSPVCDDDLVAALQAAIAGLTPEARKEP